MQKTGGMGKTIPQHKEYTIMLTASSSIKSISNILTDRPVITNHRLNAVFFAHSKKDIKRHFEAKREKEGFKVFVNCLKQSGKDAGLFLFEIKLIEKWRVG